MKQAIKLGRADFTVLVFIPDPASTDGSGKTGLAHTDMTVSYTRVETDNDVTVTDATSSLNALTNLTDAHNDWGWKEVSSTLAPGLYRLDLADAVLASGIWSAVVYVMVTTSAAAASPMEFVAVAYDPLDTVRLGLTALPNAAADAAGGLIISDAGGLDADAQRTDVANILVDTGTTLDARIPAALVSGRMDASVGAVEANVITADSIANGAIDAATFAADVDAEILSYIVDDATRIDASSLNTASVTSIPAILDDTGTAGVVVASIAANAITATAIAADAITAAKIAAGAIDAATFAADVDAEILSYIVDDATRIDASSLNTASVTTIPAILDDTGTAGVVVASIAAGAITAAAIATDAIDSDAIAATAVTEIQSGLATAAALTTVDDFLDTEIAAIKAQTDLIPGTIDGKTFAAGWTLAMAALLGKASGMGTATGVIRAVDDSKDRITATIDANGNRTAVTLDAT